ncbi:MAG: lysostaphin resistance A-like protein [bacterium]
MDDQNSFIKMEDIKTPAALFFIAVYISALVMVVWKDPSNALAFIGMSIGMLFLIWLIIEITKKVQAPDFEIKKPGWELAFGLFIIVIWDFAPLPKLEFGDKWSSGFMLKKCIIFVALPFAFLKFRKKCLSSMGLTATGWKNSLTTGLIVFFAMAIPSAFYSNTASSILSGKLSPSQVGLGFPLSFTYYLFMSGFSEEFFFRAFIQTRFSTVLQSKIGGVLITALLFGLLHIPNIMRWYPGATVAEAFCRAFFVQTFLGLIFGVLWERTRNLISCVFVHTGVDGLNNLGWMISKLSS